RSLITQRQRLAAFTPGVQLVEPPHILPSRGEVPVGANGLAVELSGGSPVAATLKNHAQQVEVGRVAHGSTDEWSEKVHRLFREPEPDSQGGLGEQNLPLVAAPGPPGGRPWVANTVQCPLERMPDG